MPKRGRGVPKSQCLGEGRLGVTASLPQDGFPHLWVVLGRSKDFWEHPQLQRPEPFIAGTEPKGCCGAWKPSSAFPSPPPIAPPVNTPLSCFNKALPAQMLTPVMLAEPAEGINSKSPFK